MTRLHVILADISHPSLRSEYVDAILLVRDHMIKWFFERVFNVDESIPPRNIDSRLMIKGDHDTAKAKTFVENNVSNSEL